MMYASKIDIKREPQEIRFTKEVEFESNCFTLEMLRKYVNEGESFSINETDEGLYSITILSISSKRLETDKEVSIRVAKQEKYMENYYKHHAKYARDK